MDDSNTPEDLELGTPGEDLVKVSASNLEAGGVMVFAHDGTTGASSILSRADTVKLRDWLNEHLGDTEPQSEISKMIWERVERMRRDLARSVSHLPRQEAEDFVNDTLEKALKYALMHVKAELYDRQRAKDRG